MTVYNWTPTIMHMTCVPLGAVTALAPPKANMLPVVTLKISVRRSALMLRPDTLAAAIAEVVFTQADAFTYNTLLNIAVPVGVPSFVAYTVALPFEVVTLAM